MLTCSHEWCVCVVAQSCLTVCDSMDCSSPGSSAHWILQARILEWVAISFSRGLNPVSPHCRQILCCLNHQGNPWVMNVPKKSKQIMLFWCWEVWWSTWILGEALGWHGSGGPLLSRWSGSSSWRRRHLRGDPSDSDLGERVLGWRTRGCQASKLGVTWIVWGAIRKPEWLEQREVGEKVEHEVSVHHLYKWGNWGREKLGSLLEVLQLVRGRSGIESQLGLSCFLRYVFSSKLTWQLVIYQLPLIKLFFAI